MKILRRFALASTALALGGSALAQSLDTASSSPSTPRAAAATAPVSGGGSSKSTKAVLVPFAPYVTQNGAGAGGADVSELYTNVGYNTYGVNFDASEQARVAEDFTVPGGQTWDVSQIKWMVYQTGAPTTGTLTSLSLNLWNSNPTGQNPGGQALTGGNQFQSQTFSGVYRVADYAVGSNERALIEVTCNGAWIPPLPAGTYYLEASATGSVASGPWAAPKTVSGQTPPTGSSDFSLQSYQGAAFEQSFDQGVNGGINEPLGLLFQLEGTGGGAPQFCSSKPTSIPGCVPTLSGPAGPISKGGAPGATLDLGPAPGGGNPGIAIYSVTGQTANPINTQFGELCIQNFFRASAFAKTPGGTLGNCNGNYAFDLQGIVNTYAAIQPGGNVWAQVWYRDTGAAAGANFMNGVGPIAVN
jgi:hypothetical protein